MQRLLDLPLGELLARARDVRDGVTGTRVTYSPKVFVPLTMLCRDRCGYCTFAQPPARLDSPYLSPERVLAIARAGAQAGCHEALFTLGERPEERYPAAADWLAAHGYASTVDYLAAMCRLVIDETGLLPHANAGALHEGELARLREVAPSQGMMLESLRDDLEAHRGSPDKTPERRLATLEAAGRLGIPFTTGILGAEPCPPDAHLEAIALARLVLPADVVVQAPPNLSDDFGVLLDAGIADWGGVSPVTADHVNPERPWPALDRLRAVTEARGFALAPRLTVYPEFATAGDRWLDPGLVFAVGDRADAEGLGRDDPGSVFPERTLENARAGTGAEIVLTGIRSTAWYSGADAEPPTLVPGARGAVRGRVAEILEGVRAGQTVGEDEIVALFAARGPEVVAVAEVADELRREAVGATEVCLQGGIHPDFDGDYYIDVARAVKEAVPDIHVHGFTALEVTEGAKRLDEPLDQYLRRLMDAGLRSLPGTAAEILDDPVRAVLCPDKISTDEWLECHRVAHGVGLRSNVTIMFGAVESPRAWARHLLRTRALQAETGGFTEFVGLPFVHMATPLYLQRKARRGPTFREVLLMHAVARITYRDLIDNIQLSWVKLGAAGGAQLLQAGCNDLGGTLMDENISRAAGATHGQEMTPDDFAELVEPLGRTLRQRTTLYGSVEPAAAA